MLKKLLIALVVVVVIFLGYVAAQPSDFKIAREIRINAPAEVIFPYVNNAKKLDEWNPWMKLDPNTQVTYTGPAEGKGSASHWVAGSQVGTGSATIIDSVPYSLVRTRLDYVKPFESTNTVEFNLKSEGNQTVVTWSNEGKNKFIGRIMCTLFFNMDKMVGGMFEKGLADLKTLAESQKK
jgi:uncharacterized protein YndB with AHSA1/START domain